MFDTEDLVKRLRERAGQYDEYDWHGDIEREAADLIEKLQQELKREMLKLPPVVLTVACGYAFAPKW